LVATLLAFFCAVGLAAHALDELHGRPLRTRIPSAALVVVATIGLLGAVTLGVAGVIRVGWALVPFMVVGYNFELFGGVVHTDFGFAAAWGAFPVLTAYVAQTGRLAVAPVIAAAGAFALSWAQRSLSTPARLLRRRATQVSGCVSLSSGDTIPLDDRVLLAPLERALSTMSWAIVLLATALAVARLS
jgi:hypothetical protein